MCFGHAVLCLDSKPNCVVAAGDCTLLGLGIMFQSFLQLFGADEDVLITPYAAA